MTKMKNMTRPSNYVPPQGASSFPKNWDEGEYFAVGIKWVHKDSDEQPVLKAQKDGVMSARLRFIVKGEEKKSGPYYMADLASMNLLTRAFNKDVVLLPVPDEKDASQVRKFLNYCGEAINSSGNEVKFKINSDGYIQWVDGTFIEVNVNYIMRVVRIMSKNEQGILAWRKQEFGDNRSAKLIDIVLEIVAGNMGAETPFKGAQFRTSVPYGFHYYEDEDAIGFEANDNGEDTSRAYALRKFMTVYCPRLMDEGAETSYPNDVHNIVPWMHEWHDEVVFQAEVRGKEGKNGGMFYNVNWGKLIAVTGTPLADNLNVKPLEVKQEAVQEVQVKEVVPPQPKVEETVDDSDIDAKAQLYLHESLNILAGSEIFADSGGLTSEGNEIAAKYLKPLKEQGKIPPVKLNLVNYDEGQTILSALIEAVEDGEVKIKLAHKLDKLQESLLGFDEVKPEQAFDFSTEDEWA